MSPILKPKKQPKAINKLMLTHVVVSILIKFSDKVHSFVPCQEVSRCITVFQTHDIYFWGDNKSECPL